MSNEQHASTADIDSIALDVARRFTEEWDPQRRASLQVAIIQAIRTAHAPPVKLAEQQGGGSLITSEGGRRYVADFFARELRRHDFTRYITTTLAADFACALAQHLAATGKQQVGEVQGDALPPLSADQVAAMAPAGLTWDETGAWAMGYEACRKAALAARQPGAQEEVTDAAVEKAWNRFEAALQAPDGDTPEDRVLSQTIDQRDRYHEVADELADHLARIIGVELGEHSSVNCPWQNAIEAAESYMPAQGIDLGQLERIRNELHAMSGQVPDEWIDPIVELQQDVQKLIDSQRDAAPGVSHG